MIDGEVGQIVYRYGTMTDWVAIGATPPRIPLGTAVELGCIWTNTGTEAAVGHIDATITAPDGTQTELVATGYQNSTAEPEATKAVTFVLVLTQLGSPGYSCEFVLSMEAAGVSGCIPQEIDVTFTVL